MTYRSDGGVKCARCSRGFSPDDLSLDVTGAWLCKECERLKGDEEASAALAEGRQRVLRMRLFGVSLVLLAALGIGARYVSHAREERRLAARTVEVTVKTEASLARLRAAVALWQLEGERRDCGLAFAGRTDVLELPFVEADYLLHGTGTSFLASDAPRMMMFFSSTPRPDLTDRAGAALAAFESSPFVAVLVPTKRSADVGADEARWEGKVVIARVGDLVPSCWRSMAVATQRDELDIELPKRARAVVRTLSADEATLAY